MKKIKLLTLMAFACSVAMLSMNHTKLVEADTLGGTAITETKTILLDNMDDTIANGVYVDSIHIGGMTVSEAKQRIESYVNEQRSRTITIDFNGNQEAISLQDLGFNYKKNDFITESSLIGKHGNLIKRYKELKDVETNNLVYSLEYYLDEEKLMEFVSYNSELYNVLAVNATMKRVAGSFEYTDEQSGIKIEEETTIAAVKNAIFNNWNQQNIVLAAHVIIDEPLYTREMVERADDKLGSFSTTYTSSSADRAGNLANGAKLINNTVLYPGEVFSAYEKLTPFTVANGYFEAGSYANGKVVDSIGGGACQVTTTLYNALLYSELEIVERAAHSMTISYADLSRDAAIAGTWKDLKFKNNKDVPILVEVYTQGRTITFNIWGEETREANRSIKFETVILNEVKPADDVITEDATKPVSYRVTTQSPHTGYTSELIKIVSIDGQEVERSRVNKSTYLAAPRYVTIGTMIEEIEPKDQIIIPETELEPGMNEANGESIEGDFVDEETEDNLDTDNEENLEELLDNNNNG